MDALDRDVEEVEQEVFADDRRQSRRSASTS